MAVIVETASVVQPGGHWCPFAPAREGGHLRRRDRAVLRVAEQEDLERGRLASGVEAGDRLLEVPDHPRRILVVDRHHHGDPRPDRPNRWSSVRQARRRPKDRGRHRGSRTRPPRSKSRSRSRAAWRRSSRAGRCRTMPSPSAPSTRAIAASAASIVPSTTIANAKRRRRNARLSVPVAIIAPNPTGASTRTPAPELICRSEMPSNGEARASGDAFSAFKVIRSGRDKVNGRSPSRTRALVNRCAASLDSECGWREPTRRRARTTGTTTRSQP